MNNKKVPFITFYARLLLEMPVCAVVWCVLTTNLFKATVDSETSDKKAWEPRPALRLNRCSADLNDDSFRRV